MDSSLEIRQAEPNVVLSTGGLVSKGFQILLELALIYIIFAYKMKKKMPVA